MPKRNPFEDVNANWQLPKRRRKRVIAKADPTAPIDYANDEEWAFLNLPQETKVTKKAKTKRRLSLADMKTPKMSNVTAQALAAAQADAGSVASTSTTGVAAPQPRRSTTSRSTGCSSTGNTGSSSSQPESPVKLTDSEKHRRRQWAWKRGVLATIMEPSMDDATTASSDHFTPRMINKTPVAAMAPGNKKPKAQQGGGRKKTVNTKIKPKPNPKPIPQTRAEWFSEVSFGRSPTDMLSSYDPAIAYAAAQVIAARKANPPANDADSDSSPPENPALVRLMLQSCCSPVEDDEDDYPLDLSLFGSILPMKKRSSVDGSGLTIAASSDDDDDHKQPSIRQDTAEVPEPFVLNSPTRSVGKAAPVGSTKINRMPPVQDECSTPHKTQSAAPEEMERQVWNNDRRQKPNAKAASLARRQTGTTPASAVGCASPNHAGITKENSDTTGEEEATPSPQNRPEEVYSSAPELDSDDDSDADSDNGVKADFDTPTRTEKSPHPIKSVERVYSKPAVGAKGDREEAFERTLQQRLQSAEEKLKKAETGASELRARLRTREEELERIKQDHETEMAELKETLQTRENELEQTKKAHATELKSRANDKVLACAGALISLMTECEGEVERVKRAIEQYYLVGWDVFPEIKETAEKFRQRSIDVFGFVREHVGKCRQVIEKAPPSHGLDFTAARLWCAQSAECIQQVLSLTDECDNVWEIMQECRRKKTSGSLQDRDAILKDF